MKKIVDSEFVKTCHEHVIRIFKIYQAKNEQHINFSSIKSNRVRYFAWLFVLIISYKVPNSVFN